MKIKYLVLQAHRSEDAITFLVQPNPQGNPIPNHPQGAAQAILLRQVQPLVVVPVQQQQVQAHNEHKDFVPVGHGR
jgi:hypothetical protein